MTLQAGTGDTLAGSSHIPTKFPRARGDTRAGVPFESSKMPVCDLKRVPEGVFLYVGASTWTDATSQGAHGP